MDGFKWSEASTLLLISLIKENHGQWHKGVKKCLIKITKQMNEKTGEKYTWEQVNSKWKGLKRQYRKLENARPSKRTWEFYNEVEELMQLDAERSGPQFTESPEDFIVTTAGECDSDFVDFSEEATCSTYVPGSTKNMAKFEAEDDEKTGFKWTESTTLLLISLIKKHYRELQTGVKKSTFQKIAKEINDQLNTKLNSEQVDTKWTRLQRTYKKITESSSYVEQSKSWEYYSAIDEILNLSLGATPRTASSDDICITGYEADFDFVGFREEEMDSACRQSRKRSYSARDDIEEAKERRHKEKMEVCNKFLALFERMVDKM